MAIARIDTPLKLYLEGNGVRHDWLAEKLGVDPSQVSRWVNGVHWPSKPYRLAIAQTLARGNDDEAQRIYAQLWPDEATATAEAEVA